ncbi:MAG: hypothetical protein OXG54_05645 [Gammaproteobacteria bacterium]|nr:hypothetical protein [Gammaproteobacteria bacterium]
MSAFVRYPLLGCLALSLIACGSSGSQTLLRAPELSPTATTSQHASVKYLLANSAAITAARQKFVSDPSQDTDATAPTANAITLSSRRNSRVSTADRYLSTGALVTETSTTTHHAASCTDGADQTKASCVFPADAFRDEVTFHLGRTHARNNNVGFIGFNPDRQPVMDYRGVSMSQVRITGTDTKTATPEDEKNSYEYLGYDGILQYSMFFVGVYKFFDDGMGDDRELEHLRLENASLGLIYDADTGTTAIDNPTVDLTGNGVMAGVETEDGTLNSHLVQGDVGITYTASSNQIDISITNVQRLGSGTAWYTGTTWSSVSVINSGFNDGTMHGSFYGTGDNYEVGGVFYDTFTCQSSNCSIVGAFGSTMSESN